MPPLPGRPVVIKAWFRHWQVECARCRAPFESVVRPNLRLRNPAREDPEWFGHILPAAKAGGARLADFARRPLGVTLSPVAVLNLLSMRLDVSPHANGFAADHRLAELFVPACESARLST